MEKTDSFIAYVRRTMIFEKPSSDELKKTLDNKIFEIRSHEERVTLLKAIKKLMESRDIDVYYVGGITDFKSYVEYKIEEESFKSKESWNELYNDLIGKYIKKVNLEDFDEVMNNKNISGGKKRIIWLSKKTEAVYFQKEMGFTMPQFNSCFEWRNNTKFVEQNRHDKKPNQLFIDIVAKHKR
jgi:hypothetical protein